MTKSTAQPQQQSQSLLVKLGMWSVQQDVAVPLDEAPLDETQRVELAVLQRRQRTAFSRAIRLKLERLPLRPKKPDVHSNAHGALQIVHLADGVVHAVPAPVIEYVFTISDFSAATAPVNDHAATALPVCRQER